MQPESLSRVTKEQTTFRLFRCKDGCFHLEWKYFGIVHMTLLHLRVYEQLLKAVQQPQPEQRDTRVHVACNDDVELKLTDSEARALISRWKAWFTGRFFPASVVLLVM